jgi:cystathionine beta-lyase/cystathionine gamma-synthase
MTPSVPAGQRSRALRVGDALVGVSVGIEDRDNLIADLDQALSGIV